MELFHRGRKRELYHLLRQTAQHRHRDGVQGNFREIRCFTGGPKEGAEKEQRQRPRLLQFGAVQPGQAAPGGFPPGHLPDGYRPGPGRYHIPADFIRRRHWARDHLPETLRQKGI